MLSLPTITPRADASLWPSLRTAHHTLDIPDTQNTSSSAAPSTTHHSSRRAHHPHAHTHQSRSLFAQLALEENKQKQRNANIRHFGAAWIRPPGIQKTYQAMIDEEKEMKEQEELAIREQRLMDLAAAQQEAANAEEREANADNDNDMDDEGEGERDLDDDIPEAAASASDSASDISASESEDGTEGADESRADVTFNEDSFIEGSMIEGRVGQMLAMEEASMEGELLEEHDLDDDVPEAGEYEHTDSSLIDSSDEDDDGSFVQPGSSARRSIRRVSAAQSARSGRSVRSTRSARRTSGMMQVQGQGHTQAPGLPMQRVPNSRLSIELMEGSSSILESSFMRSSPVAARGGNVRERLFGARGQR